MAGLTNTDLGDDSGLWGMSVALYSSTRAKEDSFAAKHAEFVREFGGTELVPLHYTAVEYGDVLDEGHLQDEDGNYTGADQWWMLVQSALRLMQQRVSIRSDERLPRPFRRRFERANLPVPEVVVIRLRRPTTRHHSDEEGGTVNWTHQWIVDGFWRNQWFPSLGRHKQVWISPYVKGPADLPLVLKKRTYRWDR